MIVQEIKVKLWLSHSKKMTHEIRIQDIPVICKGERMTEDAVVLQFTGAIDKQGTEVCTGDVVEQSNRLYKVLSCIGGWELVQIRLYKDGGYEEGTTYDFSFLSEKYCEVVGNIFETKEYITA